MDSFFDISGQTIAAKDFNNPYAVGRQVTQRKTKPQSSQVNPLRSQDPMTKNPYRPIGFGQTYTPMGFASGGGIDTIINRRNRGTLQDFLRLIGAK